MESNQELYLAKKAAELLLPVIEKYYRAEYVGLEHIPDVPFLGVGNHLGIYFMPETFLWMGKYHCLESKPPMKVLMHSAVYKALSLLKWPEKQLGIINADPESALIALKEGSAVTVYPGGDRENSKPYCDRYKIDFFGHYGYIQLALKARVSILPVVGIGGGETLFTIASGEKIAEFTGLEKHFKIHTWPVYWSFPFGWHAGLVPSFSLPLPSQMTISILPPYSIEKYSEDDANNPSVLEHINAEIVSLMQKEMDKYADGRIPVVGKL